MTMQTDLNLMRRIPHARPGWKTRGAGVLQSLLHWTPVWVPLAFLGQLLVLGLLPARAGAARLGRAEEEMGQRVQALEEERRVLEMEAHMLGDEIYRERVRRSLVDPGATPLTLEKARAVAGP